MNFYTTQPPYSTSTTILAQIQLILYFQAKISSRNEYGFSAESVLDLFQTFDIREASTQATTDLFQKIGAGRDMVYHDAPTTKKDLQVINSEPLSTNSEKGKEKFQVVCISRLLTLSNLLLELPSVVLKPYCPF